MTPQNWIFEGKMVARLLVDDVFIHLKRPFIFIFNVQRRPETGSNQANLINQFIRDFFFCEKAAIFSAMLSQNKWYTWYCGGQN